MRPNSNLGKLQATKSLKKENEGYKTMDKSAFANTADKGEVKEPTLAELDEIIRRADEKLHQKKMEFEFISKIDKNEVSNYLLREGTTAMPGLTKKFGESPEKIKDEVPFDFSLKRAEWMDLPDRKLADHKERQKQNQKVLDSFYEPIQPKRITEIHQMLKKKKVNYSLENSNKDAEKLEEEYYNRYGTLMRNQLPQEKSRMQRNNNMSDIQEMRLLLREKMSLENPMLWNKNVLDPRDSVIASESFNRKLRELSDPAFEYDTDITKKIDTYLNGIYDMNVDKESEKYKENIEFDLFMEQEKS